MTNATTTNQMRAELESWNGPLDDFAFNRHTGRFMAWSKSAKQAHGILLDVLRAGLKADMKAPDGGPYCTGHYLLTFGAN